MYDKYPMRAASVADPTRRGVTGSDASLTREDIIQVAISLVKSDHPDTEPAEFVSDVALTFEALSGEMRRTAGSRCSALPWITPCKAPRPNRDYSFEPGRGWSKAG
jgi:hypothetical protein